MLADRCGWGGGCRELTLGQMVERTSGVALIKTDVQTEEDVQGE